MWWLNYETHTLAVQKEFLRWNPKCLHGLRYESCMRDSQTLRIWYILWRISVLMSVHKAWVAQNTETKETESTSQLLFCRRLNTRAWILNLQSKRGKKLWCSLGLVSEDISGSVFAVQTYEISNAKKPICNLSTNTQVLFSCTRPKWNLQLWPWISIPNTTASFCAVTIIQALLLDVSLAISALWLPACCLWHWQKQRKPQVLPLTLLDMISVPHKGNKEDFKAFPVIRQELQLCCDA